jgi:hypothetical protein
MSFSSTVLSTFWSPSRALAEAREQSRIAWPVIVSTAASLAFAAALLPRLDLEHGIAEELDEASATQTMSPHEREDAIASRVKLGKIGAAARAALGPAFRATAFALALWLAFMVAGGKPRFWPTLAVTAHATLPEALRALLSLPALLTRPTLAPQDLPTLLPSNLAAYLVEPTAPLGPVALLTSLDLFSLWTGVLLAIGMAGAAQVSRLRSAVTVTVMGMACFAVFDLALPALALSAAGKGQP